MPFGRVFLGRWSVLLFLLASVAAVPAINAEDSGALSPSSDTQAVADPSFRGSVFGPSGLTAAEMAEKVKASIPEPDLPKDARSLALVERVKNRWRALIDQDFDAAYPFEHPEYRANHTEKEFANQFGSAVVWHAIKPLQIDYQDGNVAKVGLILDHSFTHIPLGGKTIRSENYVTEIWTYDGGEWWHKSQSVNIPGMAQDSTGQMP